MTSIAETFSESQRQRECHETKGLISRTMSLHVRYKSVYISLSSSAKQQREITKAPSTRIRICLNLRIFLNPLSRVEKNKSSTNLKTRGRVNPDIFESDNVANSCPVCYRTINQYGGTIAIREIIIRCVFYFLSIGRKSTT